MKALRSISGLVPLMALIALGDPATPGRSAAMANEPPGPDRAERLLAADNGLASQLFEDAVYGSRGAHWARLQVELVLEKKIDALDAISRLTDVQRQKLRLAGHGDIKRIFDQIEERKARFHGIKDNAVEDEQLSIMQQAVPFNNRLNSGLY